MFMWRESSGGQTLILKIQQYLLWKAAKIYMLSFHTFPPHSASSLNFVDKKILETTL